MCWEGRVCGLGLCVLAPRLCIAGSSQGLNCRALVPPCFVDLWLDPWGLGSGGCVYGEVRGRGDALMIVAGGVPLVLMSFLALIPAS